MSVEFGILLIGALSHRADMKVKGMENSVGGETQTHTVQRRSKSPVNTDLLIVE